MKYSVISKKERNVLSRQANKDCKQGFVTAGNEKSQLISRYVSFSATK